MTPPTTQPTNEPDTLRRLRTRLLLTLMPTAVRPPVTPEARERYADDRALAGRYERLLAEAATAERSLRQARSADRRYDDITGRSHALDAALAAVILAVEAAERAAVGVRGYDDPIYRRKRLARAEVVRWTLELRRLRTAREAYRLEAMGRTGTLVPGAVRVGAHATLAPRNESVGAGQPDDIAERLDDPRIGVDLHAAISRRSPVRGAPPARPAS